MREFWIDEKTRKLKYSSKLIHTVRLANPHPSEFDGREAIHVIEYSAYRIAFDRIKTLEKMIQEFTDKAEKLLK